ncbi:MAG: YunG family protein [Micromonosporaceae bacterium]
MTELTLDEVSAALRAGWGRDTCDPVDLPDWHPGNPSRGQCGLTALILRELLGGDLLAADVHFTDGRRQGWHYWNRLPDGTEIDLTREQFTEGEVIGTPTSVTPPPTAPTRCRDQYNVLRRRVLEAVGELNR